MAGADRVQIILEAKNELSQEIRKAEKDLRSLKAQEAAMVKEVVEGNTLVKGSYDRVHNEVVQLGAEISKLREKRKILGAQERAEAKRSVQEEIEIREQIKRREAAIVSLTRRIDGITGVLVRQRRGWDLLSARISRAAATFRARWTSAIRTIDGQMRRLQSRMRGVMTSRLARYGGMAAGFAGGALAMTGLKTASSLEQTAIAYETMLGSAEKTKTMLEWIKKTTLKTPFQLNDLQLATQRMLAFGFSAKEARKNLIIVGDAAAATGLGAEGIERVSLAIGQMQGKQKIQSQEMRQLTEAGIPAWELLAEKMHMTVAELMAMSESKGGGAAIFEQGGLGKLLEGMTDRYGGLMEKQINTLGGRWSNLIDAISIGSADFIESTGIGDYLKTLMANAATWITDTFERLKTNVIQLALRLRNAWNSVKGFFKWLGDNKQNILDVALAVGAFVVTLYTLVKVTILLQGAIKGVQIAMAILNGTMAVNPVVLIIYAIAALVAGLIIAYKKVDWFRNAVDAAFRWIKKAIAWFVDWFGKYAMPVLKVYLKVWWFYLSKVVWPQLRFVFKMIGVVIKAVVWYVSEVLWPQMRLVGRNLIAIWRWVWEKAKPIWKRVTDIFNTVKDKVVSVANTIRDSFKNLWHGLTDGLSSAIETMKSWLSRIPGFDLFFNFAGGPIGAGDVSMVGELGPELFVPLAGPAKVIGGDGPEIMRFSSSGMIIPNHLIAPAVAAQAAPAMAAAAPSGGVHIENLTVQDRFDARREFDALMAKQRRIDAERR